MICDVEHIFICLVNYIPFLEEYLFRSIAYFYIGIFDFLLLSYLSSLCILDINPLSDICFAIILSPFLGFLFTLLIVSFGAQKF